MGVAMQRLWRPQRILPSLQVLLIISIINMQKSGPWNLLIVDAAPTAAAASGERHSQEYCAMYDICGARPDGKVLNCPYGSPSVKPDAMLSSKIQSMCPTITGNVCCTEAQFETLRSSVQQAVPFLVGCPACFRNFLNLFCELTCSPNQSLFINVTSIGKVQSNSTVDGIDYFITDTFGEGLYDSCKEVKFGTMNTRAMEFIGAGAKNFTDWLTFIGRKATLNTIGSPYSITFKPNPPVTSGMKPMNVSTYSCGDTALGCSCGDCPSSPECSNSAAPTSHEDKSCTVRLGSIKAKCLDFSLAIIYAVLVSGFLGWGFFHCKRKNATRTNQSSDVADSDHNQNMDRQKDEYLPMAIADDAPHLESVVRLSIVQGYLSKFYRTYGTWVAHNPAIVLFTSVAAIILLCIGLIHFKVETRPEKLWVGPGSRAAAEKQFFDSHLAPFYRIEQLIIATTPNAKTKKSPSILTDDNMKLLFEIQKKVDGIRANYSGSTVSLTDICMKPLGQACATQSVLQYFKMNQDTYDTDGGVDHVSYCFEHFTSADSCMSAFKGPLDPSTAVGGFSGNNYSEASSFIVTYPVNNGLDKDGNETGKALAWEKVFIQLAQLFLGLVVAATVPTFRLLAEIVSLIPHETSGCFFDSTGGVPILYMNCYDVLYLMDIVGAYVSKLSSVEEELKRESTADVVTIAISYLVMFLYISLTLGDTPRLSAFYISSKVLLGLSGVVLVMLSVLAAVGFFSIIGVKATLIIMEVIPFLVLAVGVDNMCILLHAAKRQPLELPLEARISNALVEVGPSITLASLSEVLAFAVGSFIPMPACRVFSMFAALAVLLDFILQVTAFVALIVFDLLRAEDKRIDCFPCIKVSSHSDFDKGIGPPEPGLLARYMKQVHAPILSVWGVKIAVVSIFVAFSVASIALCTRIEPGLEQQIVLSRDSYLQGYFNNVSEHLRIGPPVYFVVKDYNYSLESSQTNMLCSINQCDSNSLVNEISRASLSPETTHIAKPAASWLDDFLVWLSPEAFGCCRKFINGTYCPPDDQSPCCPPGSLTCGVDGICKDCTTCFLHSDLRNERPSTSQFKEKLPWFLSSLPSADCAKGGRGAYTSSIDLNGYGNGIIQASSFRTYHTPLNKQADYVNSLKAARDFTAKLSDSLKMEIFPYSVFYMFFEQYLDIWRTALIDLAIATAAVFIVCLLITSSLWSSSIILLVICMIIVDLLGLMAILKIQLNAVSVVNLIMSVGIAVEFCVHITHAFAVISGDKDQRMKAALSTMGASVFSGITLTKLVGVIVLFFARSKVFVVYYFQMYLALVILGFLHGLVFLPVILSLFGPPSRSTAMAKQDARPAVQSLVNN